MKIQTTNKKVYNIRSIASTSAKISFIIMLIVMAFGIIKYPYAPIREKDGLYFDKMRNTHSRIEYENFKIWENCMLVIGVVTGISASINAFQLRKYLNKSK